jgi:hypothetical protein
MNMIIPLYQYQMNIRIIVKYVAKYSGDIRNNDSLLNYAICGLKGQNMYIVLPASLATSFNFWSNIFALLSISGMQS